MELSVLAASASHSILKYHGKNQARLSPVGVLRLDLGVARLVAQPAHQRDREEAHRIRLRQNNSQIWRQVAGATGNCDGGPGSEAMKTPPEPTCRLQRCCEAASKSSGAARMCHRQMHFSKPDLGSGLITSAGMGQHQQPGDVQTLV